MYFLPALIKFRLSQLGGSKFPPPQQLGAQAGAHVFGQLGAGQVAARAGGESGARPGNQHSHWAGHGDGRGAVTETQGDGNKTECILGNRNEDTLPGRQGRVQLLKDGRCYFIFSVFDVLKECS